MMISLSLLGVVLLGVISSHVFGVRLFEVTRAKMGASDDARTALARLVFEVREAKRVHIGFGGSNWFTEVESGYPQQGNAIQIFPSTNSTQTLSYYLDEANQQLKRIGEDGVLRVVASFVRNTNVFTAEDYAGTILTNNRNNRVIGLTLDFYQIENPTAEIGPGRYFDSYVLRTKMTRRTLE